MLTYQDLLAVLDTDRDRAEFVRENDFAERFTQNFFRHFAGTSYTTPQDAIAAWNTRAGLRGEMG